MTDKTPDNGFRRHEDKYERETVDDVIERYSRTDDELHDTIDYLIRHRAMLRDVELKRLRSETAKLVETLRTLERDKLAEELKCFRDILALQRRLIEEGGNDADPQATRGP